MVVQIFFDKNNLQNLEFFVTLKLMLRFKDSNNKENVFFPYLLYYSQKQPPRGVL